MSDSISLYNTLLERLRADDGSVLPLFAPDFVVHEDPGMPYGGAFPGGASFVGLWHKVREEWGKGALEILFKCGDADGHVTIFLKLTGRPHGSDEIVESYVTVVWEFRDGLARWARVFYYDTPRLTGALASE